MHTGSSFCGLVLEGKNAKPKVIAYLREKVFHHESAQVRCLCPWQYRNKSCNSRKYYCPSHGRVFFTHPEKLHRKIAQKNMAFIGKDLINSAIVLGLSAPIFNERKQFIHTLATFGLAANRPRITTLLEECTISPDQPPKVRKAARDALKKIRGK